MKAHPNSHRYGKQMKSSQHCKGTQFGQFSQCIHLQYAEQHHSNRAAPRVEIVRRGEFHIATRGRFQFLADADGNRIGDFAELQRLLSCNFTKPPALSWCVCGVLSIYLSIYLSLYIYICIYIYICMCVILCLVFTAPPPPNTGVCPPTPHTPHAPHRDGQTSTYTDTYTPMCIYIYIYLFIYIYVYMYIYIYIYLLIYLFIYLSIYLFNCIWLTNIHNRTAQGGGGSFKIGNL